MSKEGKKNRKNQIIVALIAVLIPALVTIYLSNKTEKTSDKTDYEIEDNSVSKNNDGTINKTNVGNNSGTVINSQTNNYQTIENSNKGYAIKGSIELIKYLKRTESIKINQQSKNTIQVTFTGNIVPLEENTNICMYQGGNVKILINNDHCHTFKDFILNPIRSNPKNIILEELNKRIENFVANSPTSFENKILECI